VGKIDNCGDVDGEICIPRSFFEASTNVTVSVDVTNRLGETESEAFWIAIGQAAVPDVKWAFNDIEISRSQELKLQLYVAASTCTGAFISDFIYDFIVIEDPTGQVNWDEIFSHWVKNQRMLTIQSN